MGASWTCGSDAIPVLLRPCSLTALDAVFFLPPLPSNTRRLGTFRASGMSSGARPPRDQGCGPSTVGRAAQARFPRCSSVCGCTTRFLLRTGPECCCSNILPMSSLISPPPNAEVEVSIPRFCQNLSAPQQATRMAMVPSRLPAQTERRCSVGWPLLKICEDRREAACRAL